MNSSRFFILACLAALSFGLSGCGGGEHYVSATDFTPPQETARASLDAALNSWKKGLAPGRVEGTNPPVDVVDSDWSKGQKLDAFEVLSDDSADGAKRFAVRLSLKTPATTRTVNYYVLGREPIGIYLEEDYRRVILMDDNPREPNRSSRR